MTIASKIITASLGLVLVGSAMANTPMPFDQRFYYQTESGDKNLSVVTPEFYFDNDEPVLTLHFQYKFNDAENGNRKIISKFTQMDTQNTCLTGYQPNQIDITIPVSEPDLSDATKKSIFRAYPEGYVCLSRSENGPAGDMFFKCSNRTGGFSEEFDMHSYQTGPIPFPKCTPGVHKQF